MIFLVAIKITLTAHGAPHPMHLTNTRETLIATNTYLSGSQFTNVDLHEAQFTDVNLAESQFTDVNLSDTKFSDINLSNVELENCNLTGMKINGVLVTELFRAFEKKG